MASRNAWSDSKGHAMVRRGLGESTTVTPHSFLLSAALVMVMTAGPRVLSYGGLVRRKNFLAIMLQSFISMGVVTVIWVTVGYSLAFSGNLGGVHRATSRGPG